MSLLGASSADALGGPDEMPKLTLRGYVRGLLAIHGSHLHLFRLILGPAVWTDRQEEMTAVLDPLEPTPYGRFLRNRLHELLKRAPDFVTIIEQSDGLEVALDILCQVADEILFAQVSREELENLHTRLAPALDLIEDKLSMLQADGKPPLGDELDTDIETIAREPWRLLMAFPPTALGLSVRERRNLEAALGVTLSGQNDTQAVEEYAQSIMPTLLNLVLNIENVENIPPTANSRIWKWAGMSPPKRGEPLQADQIVRMVVDIVANLLGHLATIEGRSELARFVLGQRLRHEYGLGQGRGHDVIPLSDALAATLAGVGGYPEVDARLDLEALRESAPPKQREAIDIYLESEQTDRTVEELARERGLIPVNVRNNFRALGNKHKT